MLRYIVLTLSLLTGCSVFVPPYVSIVDSPYPKQEVLEAVDDFVYKWEVILEEDATRATDDIEIAFYPKTLEEWETIGCIRGRTYNQFAIRVGYVSDEEWPIYQTSIWHELVHLTLWNIWKDPDSNHSEPDGPWTKKHDELISELKEQWRKK